MVNTLVLLLDRAKHAYKEAKYNEHPTLRRISTFSKKIIMDITKPAYN